MNSTGPLSLAIRPSLSVVVLTALGTFAFAQAPQTFQQSLEESTSSVTNHEAVPLKSFPLLKDLPIVRRVVGPEGAEAFIASDADERLVYSNTLGEDVFSIPINNGIMADDITILGRDGCQLSRYKFRVIGKADPDNPGGAYRVDFALYANCPNAIGLNPPPIAGTSGFIEVDAADDTIVQHIEFVVPPDVDIPLYSTIWLGVKVNRPNVGVIGGAPALMGFSGNKVDFPGFPCSADAGLYPSNPHASFTTEVYTRGTCPATFPGYRNLHRGHSGFQEGIRVCYADDIKLGVPNCNMIGYEVGLRLTNTNIGAWLMQLHADSVGLPGAFIPGTNRTFAPPVPGGPGSYVARFNFDPPIPLPGDRVWFALQGNNFGTGWIVTRSDAQVGSTVSSYARAKTDATNRRCNDGLNPPGGGMVANPQFESVDLPDAFMAHAGFDVTIHCAGEPPTGACCDILHSDNGGLAPCRDVPRMNCPWPTDKDIVEQRLQPMWFEGTACDENPFPFACGASACCTPKDTCENLTEAACQDLAPEGVNVQWQIARYCNEEGQRCPFHACLQRQGDCYFARLEPGCQNPICCSAVCDIDHWCCETEWDEVCLRDGRRFADVPYFYCSYGPANTECASENRSAKELLENEAIVVDNFTVSDYQKFGFSCHSDGFLFPGFGSTWYFFIATDTSARIHTCDTLPPSDDLILTVFQVNDPTTPQTSCNSLQELACADDTAGCGRNSKGVDLCVENLIPGEPYYVQVASVDESDRGVIHVNFESPCPDPPDVANDTYDAADGIVIAPTALRTSPVPPVEQSSRKSSEPESSSGRVRHQEIPTDPYLPWRPVPSHGGVAHAGPWVYNGFVSVQVNVDANGNNIVGDAANEPSIAVDPTNPNRMAIGWRQFDTIESSFRQAGWAYSHDGGQHWTFPGVLEPKVFRSDPVLDSDAEGNFYFYSLTNNDHFRYDLFRSLDGGVTWPLKTYAYGGDKGWMIVDKSNGPGHGNIYAFWDVLGGCCNGTFTRSTDGGKTFLEPVGGGGHWGTMDVGPNGELYVVGSNGNYDKSINAWNAKEIPTFTPGPNVDLGGSLSYSGDPNQGGLLGQMWIVCDRSLGPTRGNVYILGSVTNQDPNDPLDVMFVRVPSGSETPIQAIRVNDDSRGNGAWQWFGTLSIAPNGRLDAFWNDTRNTGAANLSALFYTFSYDGGDSWTPNQQVSPVFNSRIGGVGKLGDYYHSVSDNRGVSIAYAATFNGEHDVYYLRINQPDDCNENGILDVQEIAQKLAVDCNLNEVPDDCEPDFDRDTILDVCDSDDDNDGVFDLNDLCQFTPLGLATDEKGRTAADTTGECDIDLNDYWRFRNCMVNGRAGAPAPMEACRRAFDRDGDNDIDLRDFKTFAVTFTGYR